LVLVGVNNESKSISKEILQKLQNYQAQGCCAGDL